MTNKDRDRIANYAIDNKISLEEAEKHFLEEKEKRPPKETEKDDYLAAFIDQLNQTASGCNEEMIPGEEILAEEEIREYEEGKFTPTEAEWWAKFNAKKKQISDEITKEEMDWVEVQLKQIDNIKL